MRKIKALVLSSLGALAVQPIVFIAWLGLPTLLDGELAAFRDALRYSLLPAVFAVPFVLFVGIPAVLLLAHYGKLRWSWLALVGFIAAGLPVSLSTPGGGPGYSSGGNWHGKPVQFIVNGEPTFYGWLNYLESIFYFGLHGFIGATVFYVLWRRSMGPNNSFKPKPLRGSA